MALVKKSGGVLLVPRPSHSKKNPAAEEEFRQELAGYLESLKIPEGGRVKLWMMDEARSEPRPGCGVSWRMSGKAESDPDFVRICNQTSYPLTPYPTFAP
jgi:hypothetical protein